MTKLQIISKQWSLIYDLLLLNKGASERTLDEIERDMDTLEFHEKGLSRLFF